MIRNLRRFISVKANKKSLKQNLNFFKFFIFLLVFIASFSLKGQNECPTSVFTDDLASLKLVGVDCGLYQPGLEIVVTNNGLVGTYLITNCIDNLASGTFSVGDMLPINMSINGSVQVEGGDLCEGPFAGFSEECTCLDNESDTQLGQFTSTYSVQAPSSGIGGAWEVVDLNNVYDPLFTNPALPELIPENTPVLELPLGGDMSEFSFQFMHIDGESYSFRIQNVDNNDAGFDVQGPISGCRYPRAVIEGDASVCALEEAVYSVEDIPQATYSWGLIGDGQIVSDPTLPTVTVAWDDVMGGGGTLSVTVTTIQGCEETAELDVVIEEDGTLACNNNINLSMDAACEIALVADMVLEGEMYENDSYEIVLWDVEADTLVPNGTITGDYVGVLLQVKVNHICGGNSCWGYITVEDKSIPPLECDDVTVKCYESNHPSNTGLPLPDGVEDVDYNAEDDTWTVYDFDACGSAVLSYVDDVTVNPCDGGSSAHIKRTWRAEDGSGGVSTCMQWISIKLADIDDLDIPLSWDGAPGNNPELSCDGTYRDETGAQVVWDKNKNGFPDKEETGRPDGVGLLCTNLVIECMDTEIPKCDPGGAGVIYVRKWQIWDLCNNDYREYLQHIKVVDARGPQCVAPNEYDAYTDPGTCTFTLDIKPPQVIFECSEWTYRVLYKLRDESGNPFAFPTDEGVIQTGVFPDGLPHYTIVDIPFESDSVWIIYELEDKCGNIEQCFSEIALHDEEEPVAVCDHHTTVSVGPDGMGFANVWAFDDGSWDNCEINGMEARRMEDTSCGIVNGFGQTVKFCCDDVGNTVMVQLKVYDVFGNYNVCMVEVEVQDNRPPELVSCPGPRTINCGTPLHDLSPYGYPEFIDNCDVTVSEDVDINLNDCGVGTVTRTFTATDPSGNTAECEQVITVSGGPQAFYINPNNPNDPNDDVVWPKDHVVFGCIDGTDPEDLPDDKDFPEVFDTECSMATYDYDDVVFQFVDGACYKILRTWTVLDWCQFDQFDPSKGIWHHTQVIKVMNSSPPDITLGCDPITLVGAPSTGCSASVELKANADDDCTPDKKLKWYYEVDLDSNGSIEYEGYTNDASRTYPFGKHKIYWSVEDQCGNTTSCYQEFSIWDIKPPTPICLDGIVTVLMEHSESVTIWASDFIKDKLDNCSAKHNIDESFSDDVNDIYRTFTCEDLAGEDSKEIELQIWVTDEEGNQDFCTTSVLIQDNRGVCVEDSEGEETVQVTISGAVYTEEAEMVSGVEVELMADMPEFPVSQMNDGGYYAFPGLDMYEDYSVEPWRNDNPMEGVSTLDLVLIQKHILGLSYLNSPYKVIAADANNSESVTAIDVVQFRKLILGLIDELPNNTSWRFVDAGQSFDNVLNPWPFTEVIEMSALDHDAADVDFVAVKLGDVNGSYTSLQGQSTEIRSSEVMRLQLEESVNTKQGTKEVVFSLSETTDLTGFQFSLSYDASEVQFEGVTAGDINMSASHLGLQDLEEGLIHMSWSEGSGKLIEGGEVLFSLRFEPTNQANISESIRIASQGIKAEGYVAEGGVVEARNLQLELKGGQIAATSFELYQNTPNPFTETTVVGFSLPEAGAVQLNVYDLGGRLVKRYSGEYSKGYNEIEIDLKEITNTGILYYQLNSGKHTGQKKMIVIK